MIDLSSILRKARRRASTGTHAAQQYADLLEVLRARLGDAEVEAALKAADIRQRWNLAECKASASSYRTRKEWSYGAPGAYGCALRNGWLDECCAHMGVVQRWTREACMASAKQYRTRSEWKGDNGARKAAVRLGCYEECCAHMEPVARGRTLVECRDSAKKFGSRKEWSEGDPNAYASAQRNGWLDECCAHMKILSQKRTLESCRDSASGYRSRRGWQDGDPNAYAAASREGWLDKCCTHMGAPHNRGRSALPYSPLTSAWPF